MDNNKFSEFKKSIWENVKSLAIAIVLAIIIRSFLIEPFKIPSSSMKPTLLIGDYLFVTKYSYGYSRYSLPFYPNLWEGRIMEFGKPERGDIIVFKLPSNPNEYFIKRLVGLPGDKVQMRNGILYINDKAIPKHLNGEFTDNENFKVPVYKEQIDHITFNTLDKIPVGPLDNTEVFSVPEGHYFFIGDNRDGSNDSRLDVGFVPYENLVGKARFIFFSVDGPVWKLWELPHNIRFKRLFNSLH